MKATCRCRVNLASTALVWDKDTYKCLNCHRKVEHRELVRIRGARPNGPPSGSKNSWERGIRSDERGVPYLDKAGSPLSMGEPFNPREYKETYTIPRMEGKK
jgi:hypothetical protein